MSQETIEWLNQNVLMGFTGDREKWATNFFTFGGSDDADAKPWFADDDFAGGFSGPVPIEAVEKLFSWDVYEGPVFSYIPLTEDEPVHLADYIDDNGVAMRKVRDETRKSLLHPNTGAFLNVVSSRYGVHQYSEWLVKNVGTILDDDLAIDSAGLLAGGGVAWVSVSLPDTIETQAGFPIRPRLLAFTAHNSKYMTTYKRSLEAPICDNSLDLEVRRDANAENKQEWRQKHTSNSHLAIAGAREALGILYQQADEMVAFVDELSQWEVTNAEFKKLMDALHPVPMPEMEGGKVANKRAITNVTNRRGEITTMYLKDDRAAPWKGTALGVLQAFNTWHQHGRTIRGERVERKMLDTLATDVADFDAIVLNSLAELCDRDLVAVGSGD